jgi:hypothetical protein
MRKALKLTLVVVALLVTLALIFPDTFRKALVRYNPFGVRTSGLSPSLIDQYKLKEEDFKQLQYYLADDLILTRQVHREEKKERVKGKLVKREGEIVEEVVVKKGTPGICLATDKCGTGIQWLEISFEEGSSFKFTRNASNTLYTVVGKEQGRGVDVEFAGNTYRTTKQNGETAYLEVGEESLKNAEKRRRTLSGRKLEP